MRLKVAFYPAEGRPVRPNKHAVQGFIYNMLKGTGYGDIHEGAKFKFFTFSDFFTDRRGNPTFIVSSPNRGFIDALHSSLKDRVRVYIGTEELTIAEVRKFRLPLTRRFQTGSPVVIHRDSRRNEYFKLYVHRDLNFFLDRLRENAEKKYNAFYGEDFHLDDPIFDRMVPKVRRNGKIDVYVRIIKGGGRLQL
ncbi:CRISPR-associated endoribonuclease Cas6 [Thermococcus sp.]